jgi:lipopolysaccharide transport system ATP-binding protein
MDFQEKSFSKIREFKSLGTTILLVSHDRAAVASICDRALLLDGGKIVIFDTVDHVLDCYNALLASNQPGFSMSSSSISEHGVQVRSGNGKARVADVNLFNLNDQSSFFHVGDRARLRINFEICDDLPSVVIGYSIKNRFGQIIYGTNSEIENLTLQHLKKGQLFLFESDFLINIAPGEYSVQVALTRTASHLHECYEWLDRATFFEIIQTEYFEGLINMSPSIKITECSGDLIK